jgi:hypothetical protein
MSDHPPLPVRVGLALERRLEKRLNEMERENHDKPIKRSKGFIFQNADKKRALDFMEGRDPKKFLHRQMQDFSEAELQELQRKVEVWMKSSRVLPTFPETVMEEY